MRFNQRRPLVGRGSDCWHRIVHYVLAFSGGFGSLGVTAASSNVETQSPWKEILADPAQAQKSLQLFLGFGQSESGVLMPARTLVALLKEKGVNGHWGTSPAGTFSVFGATI